MTLKSLIIIMVMGIATNAVAQSVDIRFFNGKTRQTQKRLQQNIKEYKRIKRENQAYLKSRKKEYKQLKDSLRRVKNPDMSKDSLRYLSRLQKRHLIYTDSLYRLEDMASWDSLNRRAREEAVKRVDEQLHSHPYFQQYNTLLQQMKRYKKELRHYRDSLRSLDTLNRHQIRYLTVQKRKELADKYERDLESNTRRIVNQQAPELPGGFQNDQLEKFKTANEHLKKPINKEQLLSRAQSIDHFKGKEEVLKTAMKDVSELKEKYSKVIDSNDLSTATKVNSLKDEPLARRIVFGGTFQLYIDEITAIDINPEISYRINKRMDAGLGGTYRVTINVRDRGRSVSEQQVFGYRGFAEHHLFKSFYVHAEAESLHARTGQADASVAKWYASFLAGLERHFHIRGKMKGQASVLYNFSNRKNPLYNSPWVFRVGFQWQKK